MISSGIVTISTEPSFNIGP